VTVAAKDNRSLHPRAQQWCGETGGLLNVFFHYAC